MVIFKSEQLKNKNYSKGICAVCGCYDFSCYLAPKDGFIYCYCEGCRKDETVYYRYLVKGREILTVEEVAYDDIYIERELDGYMIIR